MKSYRSFVISLVSYLSFETYFFHKIGFNFFYGHLGGGHRYFPEELTIKDSYSISDEPLSYKTWIMRDHNPEKTDQYLTDEFSDEAVNFVIKNKLII